MTQRTIKPHDAAKLIGNVEALRAAGFTVQAWAYGTWYDEEDIIFASRTPVWLAGAPHPSALQLEVDGDWLQCYPSDDATIVISIS